MPLPEQGPITLERLSRLALVVAGLVAPVRVAALSTIMSGLARSLVGPGWTARGGDAVRLSGQLIVLEADGVCCVVNAAAATPSRSTLRRVRL